MSLQDFLSIPLFNYKIAKIDDIFTNKAWHFELFDYILTHYLSDDELNQIKYYLTENKDIKLMEYVDIGAITGVYLNGLTKYIYLRKLKPLVSKIETTYKKLPKNHYAYESIHSDDLDLLKYHSLLSPEVYGGGYGMPIKLIVEKDDALATERNIYFYCKNNSNNIFKLTDESVIKELIILITFCNNFADSYYTVCEFPPDKLPTNIYTSEKLYQLLIETFVHRLKLDDERLQNQNVNSAIKSLADNLGDFTEDNKGILLKHVLTLYLILRLNIQYQIPKLHMFKLVSAISSKNLSIILLADNDNLKLNELTPDDSEYQRIQKSLKLYNIKAIYQVNKTDYQIPNKQHVKRLYHGTKNCSIVSILNNHFMTAKQLFNSKTIKSYRYTGNGLGDGVYFANAKDIGKAINYTNSDTKTGFIFECDCYYDTVETVEDYNSKLQSKCDLVFGKNVGSYDRSEYVICDPKNIEIKNIIMFEKM